jgi:predicted metal-dependent phosphoesterase TrpH
MRIDLHTHSAASDGTLSPAALVRSAADSGLDVVALTDHDTTAGWAEAVAAVPAGLTLIRGAELSSVWWPAGEPPISLHLLAYLFDPTEPRLRAERERVREGRVGRARTMVERMTADGHDMRWDDVVDEAAGGPVGRPHVARAMVRRGLVSTMDEAFTPAWIGAGGRYRVAKPDTNVLAAIELVRGAGGVPVFAHPMAAKRGQLVPDGAYAVLAEAGLAGIEADHVDHEPAARQKIRAIAAELGLFVTGSSDFHGANKTIALGAETTDPQAYERLVSQARGVEPVRG